MYFFGFLPLPTPKPAPSLLGNDTVYFSRPPSLPRPPPFPMLPQGRGKVRLL